MASAIRPLPPTPSLLVVFTHYADGSQVRCDAASLGVPCTNCVAFNIECRIPSPKRKKAQAGIQSKDSDRYFLLDREPVMMRRR